MVFIYICTNNGRNRVLPIFGKQAAWSCSLSSPPMTCEVQQKAEVSLPLVHSFPQPEWSEIPRILDVFPSTPQPSKISISPAKNLHIHQKKKRWARLDPKKPSRKRAPRVSEKFCPPAFWYLFLTSKSFSTLNSCKKRNTKPVTASEPKKPSIMARITGEETVVRCVFSTNALIHQWIRITNQFLITLPSGKLT